MRFFFSVSWWLIARLSRRVGGVPRALGFLLPCAPGASARSCWMAAVICLAHGHRDVRRRRSRRPPRTIRPAAENRRSRSRFGSQRRAVPVRASSWVQAISSHARATIWHQIWFCA